MNPRLRDDRPDERLHKTRIHVRASLHELRCRECRVTWGSWLERLVGLKRGCSPKVRP